MESHQRRVSALIPDKNSRTPLKTRLPPVSRLRPATRRTRLRRIDGGKCASWKAGLREGRARQVRVSAQHLSLDDGRAARAFCGLAATPPVLPTRSSGFVAADDSYCN